MATLTIRNVPDDLYERLKALAKRNRRSLNQEAIQRLERSTADVREGAHEKSQRLAAFRASLPRLAHSSEEIDRWKREGRP
ncbi:MAG TPA: Arc family DNA-binding protein [Tepidiformaceae bacterium]|nr:Arc family DNA-binding protein [Tepidiformaceae bacterium]HMO94714.1 Arc family DNA-binding protein [Tepidiformaceae bacterium]